MNSVVKPKMHGYAHFAEFGGAMNSVVGPQKKAKCTETHIQCYPNSH